MLKKIRNWFIDRTPLSTRLYIGRVLIVLLPVLTIAKPTFAQWLALLGGAAAISFLPIILDVIVGILGSIFNLITTIAIAIINSVILPGQNALFFSAQIQNVFEIMRGAANVLFFLAILIFAIMIITRSAGYNFKKAITSLVTAVVMANFSFTIVLVLIEMGDALRNSASTIFGDGSITNIGQLWDSLFIPSNYTFSIFQQGSGSHILLTLATLAVAALGAYVFFRLAFVLVERAVRLIWQAIFGPIVFALSLLPEPSFSKMASNWWSDTIRWVLVLPIAFILISIAQMLMNNYTGGPLSEQLQGIIQTESVTNAGQLIYLIIPIAILLIVAETPKLLQLSTSAATKFFTDTIPGAITGAIKSGATFYGGAALRGAGMKLQKTTKLGGWVYKEMGKFKARRQIAEGVYRTHKKALTTEGNIATVIAAKKARKDYTDNINNALAKELGIGVDQLEAYKETHEDEYNAAKKKVEPRFIHKKTVVDSKEMAAMVAQGEMIKENYELYRSPEELAKSVKENMKEAKEAWDNGQDDKAHKYELLASTDMLTLKQMQVRSTGSKADVIADIYNELNKDYRAGSSLLSKRGTPLAKIPQPKMQTDELAKRGKDDQENNGTAGSALKTEKEKPSIDADRQLIRQWKEEKKYQAAQKAKQDFAQEVGDTAFVSMVDNVNNLKGGSAILQIIQKAAESDNPEALKNIASISELLAKLPMESEEKISDIQSRYGSDKDSIKTALQSEVGISEADSDKAANLLSRVGVKDIGKVSSIARSLKEEKEKKEGRLKAKIDYIQVQAAVPKEQKEPQITTGTPIENMEANEQRIEAAMHNPDESYPIQEIKDDIKRATEQLKKIVLQSAQTNEERTELYQKRQLGRIQHDDRTKLQNLATKIFSKLKHYHQGSVVDSETQVGQMTPKDIYKILRETQAAADKLSGGSK